MPFHLLHVFLVWSTYWRCPKLSRTYLRLLVMRKRMSRIYFPFRFTCNISVYWLVTCYLLPIVSMFLESVGISATISAKFLRGFKKIIFFRIRSCYSTRNKFALLERIPLWQYVPLGLRWKDYMRLYCSSFSAAKENMGRAKLNNCFIQNCRSISSAPSIP